MTTPGSLVVRIFRFNIRFRLTREESFVFWRKVLFIGTQFSSE
jgi:hypothetical protein